ncbi:hypothetical protein ABWH98_20935 [Labrenzia sp. ac12]|nr:hypothetical protein [Pseudomonadota bacterium]
MRILSVFLTFFSLFTNAWAENTTTPVLQIVAFKGGTLNLRAENITEVNVQPVARSQEIEVNIRMDAEYRDAFRKLSIESRNLLVIVLVCGEEVFRPVILEPIISGRIYVGQFSKERASETVDLLSGRRSCGE